MLAIFLATFAVAQDPETSGDGAVERIAQSAPVHEYLQMQRALEGVEHLEGTLGREKVAALYVESVARASQAFSDQLSDQVQKITEDQASSVLENLKLLYSNVGAVSVLRTVRNVERSFASSRDRLVTIFTRLAQSTRVKNLERMLADHGGALSVAIRSAMNQRYSFNTPFMLTRIWMDLFDNTTILPVGKVFLGFASVIVLPVFVGVDLFLLPVQICYWVASFIRDILTTSPEELQAQQNAKDQVIARLREELRLQGQDLAELRERLKQLTEVSRSEAEIRR